jgi:hypothetical protein
MSFRGQFLTFILSLSVFGCSLRVGEKPAQNAEIRLGEKVGCLSNIGLVTSRFFQGELENEELEEFADCTQLSLESFENYTVGEEKETYHPEEIRHFLHLYFLKDRTISDALLQQAMNLKVIVLGGNKTSVSRLELKRLIELIDVWRSELLTINRFMKIYNWKKSKELKREYPPHIVDTSLVALKSSLLSIFGSFEGVGVRYDTNNLEVLVEEYRTFTGSDRSADSEVRSVQDWTFLLQTFKKFALSHSRPEMTLLELKDLVQEVVDWLGLVIKYQYFVKEKSWLEGDGLEAFHAWVIQVFQTVDRSLSRQALARVPYTDVHQFLLALERFLPFPYGVKADDIKEFAPSILQQMLRDRGANATPTLTDFFYRKQLHVAYSTYTQWHEIQAHLSNQFALSPFRSRTSFITEIPLTLSTDVSSGDAVRDLNRMIRSVPPLYKRGEETIFLVEARKMYEHQLSHDFYNLTYMNIYRTLLQLLMRGYAEEFSNQDSTSSSLTSEALQAFYLDLKPLGVKVGLMDPRSNTAGSRSFIEANLFTYASNGIGPNATMSFEEGLMFLSYLWSGSTLSKEVYDELRTICGHGPADIRDQEKLDRPCVERELPEALKKAIRTMPGLEKYLNDATPEQAEQFGQDLIASSIGPFSSTQWVERAEIGVMSMIVHYTESVMTRFNLDGDLVLERDEINSAIPIFSGFIRAMALSQCMDKLDDQRVEDVFRHIVETGEIPESKSYWSDFGLWTEFRRRRKTSWEPQLDRGQMTRVFSSIISKSVSGVGEKKKCNQ